jgi:hypothetical protein
MAFKKPAGKKTGVGGFEYKKRTKEDYDRRATAGAGREGFLAEGVTMFSPKAGDHSIRILPPTWDEAEHYGFDAYAHYDIGPDGGAYLCLDRMKGEPCPICEARSKAIADGEEELQEKLKWRRRVLCYVIDRDNEKEGPLLWSMPQSLDKEISSVCQDKKTGEVYDPDDPSENGYDVSFTREGEKLKTKYVSVQVDRRSSPLSEDEDQATEWLTYIQENPVPDQLVFPDPDHIARLVEGGLTSVKGARDKAKDDKDDDDKKGRGGKFGSKRKEKEPEPEADAEGLTWDDVHALEEGDLQALADEHDVDISGCESEEEAADLICSSLEIEAPEGEEAEPEEEEKPARKPVKKSTPVKKTVTPVKKSSRLDQLRKKSGK